MIRNSSVFAGILSLACCLAFCLRLSAQAQLAPVQHGAQVIHETHHDISPPLSDLAALYGQQQPQPGAHRVVPLGRFGNPYPVPPAERDPALQETEGPLVSTTDLLNFNGLTASQSGGLAVPDTNGAVGDTEFVQTVNTAYEVFDKSTGGSLLAPVQISTIFAGFGGVCESGPSFGDPIVLFDRMASRWVVSIIGSADKFQTGLECVAVSTTSDAIGSYNRYAFSFGNNLGDYPKLGSWPDAYYLTVNTASAGALQAHACALDRSSMLAGNAATMQCFPTEQVLHSFTGGTDGAYPEAGLVRDAAGNLYGTTAHGGAYGYGTVFRVSASGTETVLHSFTYNGTDGVDPEAGLVRDTAGNLYGTTAQGGAYTYGTVFEVSASGTETVLHSFTGGADGASPYAGLVRDAAGNLYGTTVSGGAYNYGTVFEVSASGTETVLHSFTGGTDGRNPGAGLVRDAAGNLYGTTAYGGSYSNGTVFEVSASGTETVLHSFTGGTDGAYPGEGGPGLVRDAAGNLYGTTGEGGAYNYGTVFEVSASGAETVLYSFTGGAYGEYPAAGLVRDAAGNLYGTTVDSGIGAFGTVFEVSASGTETVLHSFTGGTDGASPRAGLVRDAAGNLYGTTVDGGAYTYGTVFEVTPGTLMPADFDGTIAPPPGEPNFLLSIAPNAPGKSLRLFKFHVDFTNPANSTLTGPTPIAVAHYNQACGGQGTCIPQEGASQQLLDSVGDRLMFRLAYRNFGDHEALVVNHSVSPPLKGIVAAVRWYEIRDPNGTPAVFQQGTFASTKNNFWMGSVAMDKNGDVALGFSTSSSATYPGIAYTGRVPTDPLGKMESPKGVIKGGGSQNGGMSRWGDYSSMAIDPVDDCTFWYTTEYLKTSGKKNWDTRIVSFKFDSCQ